MTKAIDNLAGKSTIDEIRERFDGDVERFSNLESGQSATIDAPLAMELITEAAVASTPAIRRVLDIGCGAGNNSIKLRQVHGKNFDVDLVSHETSSVYEMMWDRYGKYLCELGGEGYRDTVFEYIEKEDSPRPVTYQLDLLRRVGFTHVELLHKNSCFAAFGALKK